MSNIFFAASYVFSVFYYWILFYSLFIMEAPPNSPVTVNVYDMVRIFHKNLMLLCLGNLFHYSSFYFYFIFAWWAQWKLFLVCCHCFVNRHTLFCVKYFVFAFLFKYKCDLATHTFNMIKVFYYVSLFLIYFNFTNQIIHKME